MLGKTLSVYVFYMYTLCPTTLEDLVFSFLIFPYLYCNILEEWFQIDKLVHLQGQLALSGPKQLLSLP